MNRVLSSVLFSGVLLAAAAPHAQADIIFGVGPSFVSPDENLQFNGEGLVSSGITVQGMTNQTNTIFNLSGQESLMTPASGQARVEDEAENGFNRLLIDALSADIFFREFEANLNAITNGNAKVEVRNSAGVTETFDFAISSAGQNFFGLRAVSGQMIDTVLIMTDVALADVRQIRLGGIVRDDGDGGDVPEPTTLVLLGAAFSGLGLAARRRR